ncbi:MAG: DUF4430 domain-containing protein [Bacilli bacterium]
MKKKIIPLILSIIVVAIMIGLIIFIYHGKKTTTSGWITIYLYTEERELISQKELSFTNNQTFYELLNENYDIEMRGTMLVKIDSLEAHNTSEKFIKIYHNNVSSKYGVMQLEMHDQDEIVFIIEKTKINGDYNEEFN